MREIEVLRVITYERKYINIVKSCSFLLSKFEELKSCIYRVETVNAGMGLYWLWLHLFIMLLEEIVLLYGQESLQNTIFDESMQSLTNAHPTCCWVAHV